MSAKYFNWSLGQVLDGAGGLQGWMGRVENLPGVIFSFFDIFREGSRKKNPEKVWSFAKPPPDPPPPVWSFFGEKN